MNVSHYHPDTICALATPPGRGGIGIVRISGPDSLKIAQHILKFTPRKRFAHYTDFHIGGKVLDQGIALFFPGPHSFTGEDVVELQGHGGPVIMDMILSEISAQGARLANPGEFSERAFLNDKLDLAQAEAIADLIDASSQQAAKRAINSLKGEFSKKIEGIVEKLIHLRMYVESAIDFPEEEIDFLNDGKVEGMLTDILALTDDTLREAQQGVLLREGMKVVIAGRPNAGKSSLLNQLAQRDLAIVTNIPGTTRDVLREHIHIDGLPIHIADTAGLRESPDQVEQIGIERAWKEIEEADRILLMIDSTDQEQLDINKHWQQLLDNKAYASKLTIIYNKIDQSLLDLAKDDNDNKIMAISALTGDGIDELKQHLKAVIGYEGTTEGSFSARRRHINAIEKAKDYLTNGQQQLRQNAAGELLAEDLKYAQNHLNEITGSFTPDDLLGKIFSSFCIGK
ncbi:tRNA uridine-5-carboxymethylaminomethyl(34) synthesis GTPase MnmE [Agarilytica rhodophyticola]|uniref:tRNA uridine-5-carboxymethylaminomethyl(34) synthesis GTPase MnmE n=1 Tax=Agarilytica rhodophyticola TaxID=1737490 RepID=UPI003CCB7801